MCVYEYINTHRYMHVYVCSHTHTTVPTYAIILIITHVCHPKCTFNVGSNLRRYEILTYTHFNPHVTPYKASPTEV